MRGLGFGRGQLLAVLRVLALTAPLGACDRSSLDEGLYYWGAEVNVICPCGTDACYWVRGEPEVLEPLKAYVQKQTSRPYQPVHVVYRGRMLDERKSGFAVNYDGYQTLLEVRSVSTSLPEHCPSP